jgi:hypothetical protein
VSRRGVAWGVFARYRAAAGFVAPLRLSKWHLKSACRAEPAAAKFTDQILSAKYRKIQ